MPKQYCNIHINVEYITYCIWSIHFAGILLSSQSPPVSTPLEPCRVAPYVNLPSLRGTSVATPSTPQHFPSSAAAAAAAFSAFDPALLSAAHQVFCLCYVMYEGIIEYVRFELVLTTNEYIIHLQ